MFIVSFISSCLIDLISDLFNILKDDVLDEDQQEEIYDYFMEAESDKIQDALDEFDGDYDEEELRLMRIKFINEVAN